MARADVHSDARRAAVTSWGAWSLLLAAVMVLSSSPALLAGGLADPTSTISRVGSQLRRLATAMPLRMTARRVERDLHRPALWELDTRRAPALVGDAGGQQLSSQADGVRRLPLSCVDLPPPSRVG